MTSLPFPPVPPSGRPGAGSGSPQPAPGRAPEPSGDTLFKGLELTPRGRPGSSKADDIEDLEATDGDPSSSPVVSLVNRILIAALRCDASDIHVEPQEDGLTIRYQTISGRYDTSGPAPRIVFDQPTPAGTVTIPYTLGAWRVGYRVEAATLEQDAVVVETDWKRVRIALED